LEHCESVCVGYLRQFIPTSPLPREGLCSEEEEANEEEEDDDGDDDDETSSEQ
jgi:hypothetical protein